VSDLDRFMNISLWVQVAHSSFIEGSHTTKNTASVHFMHEQTKKLHQTLHLLNDLYESLAAENYNIE
jgi:hypothetical protein